MRKINSIALILLSFVVFNCETGEELIIQSAKSPKIKISSLDKEPYLKEVLDLAGFKANKNSRTNGQGNNINTDSILMVLQADSSSYTYTFKVENKTTHNSFTNLVLKRVVDGFNAFYLTYEFEGNFNTDITHFSGTVTSYKLDGSVIVAQHFQNGNPANSNTSGRTALCVQTISVDKRCITNDPPSMTTDYELPCLHGWETVITISYSSGCYLSDSDGSSNSGGGLPSQYTSYTWSNGTFVPFAHWSDGSIPGAPQGPSNNNDTPCTSADGGTGLESGADPNSCSDNIGIIPPTEEELLYELCAAGYCIQNQLTTPCLKNTADKVLNPNLASTYNNLIQDIFNSSDKVNLILKEGVITDQNGNPNGALGATGHALITSSGVINVDITLDPAKFITSSQEFIAAAIYHECFHAIINSLSNNNVSSDDEHIAMYTNYLNLLATGIESAYPNMPPGDAKGLILYGLLSLDSQYFPLGTPGKWPTVFVNKILSHSGFTHNQVNLILNRYQIQHTSGTPCN